MSELNAAEKWFEKLSDFVSRIVGSPFWFFFSVVVILVWIPSRPLFETNELWHLFINTFTTILTFLMMALLHASQSKWETRMERMEQKQERLLKLVEKDTHEIKKDIIEKFSSETSVNSNR